MLVWACPGAQTRPWWGRDVEALQRCRCLAGRGFEWDRLLILMVHLIFLGWLYQDPLISKLLSLPLSCVCSALGLSLGGSPAALPAALSPDSEGSVAGSLCPSSMLLVRVAGGASCVLGLGGAGVGGNEAPQKDQDPPERIRTSGETCFPRGVGRT